MIAACIHRGKNWRPHNNDRNIKPAWEEHSMSKGAEAEGQAIPQRLHSDYWLNLLWYLTASLTTRGCIWRILSTFIPKHFTGFINDPLDPFGLLWDGTWQLFNSHIAMLQCFRAEKKNPASSLSCREYLGKGNVIIHIGSGPGLGALGKEAFRTSTFQPTWKMGPPFSSLGHQPASCWLRKKLPGTTTFTYSPSDPSPGWKVSFPGSGWGSAGKIWQRPGKLPHTHQFGFNIIKSEWQQVETVFCCHRSRPWVQEQRQGQERQDKVCIFTCAFAPVHLCMGKIRRTSLKSFIGSYL